MEPLIPTSTSAAAQAGPTNPTIVARTPSHSSNPTAESSAFTDNHHANHVALISGLVFGAVVFIILICGFACLARKKCGEIRTRARVRLFPHATARSIPRMAPGSTQGEVTSERDAPKYTTTTVGTAEGGMARSDSQTWTTHDLRQPPPPQVPRQELDGKGVTQTHSSTTSGRHHPNAISSGPSDHQACMTAARHTTFPSPSQGLAPPLPTLTPHTKRNNLNKSLPDSPSVSSMPLPITPGTNTTTTPATNTTTTASSSISDIARLSWNYMRRSKPLRQQKRTQSKDVYTPSTYRAGPPTSLRRPGQEGKGPPTAQTPMTPYRAASAPPSSPPPPQEQPLYELEDTSSAADNADPPSASPNLNDPNNTPSTTNDATLPAPPSALSLTPTLSLYARLNSNVDLYRGLSTRSASAHPPLPGRDERPPWDFLSAEDARAGGWRNRDSVGGKSLGWETVGEGEEEE